MARKKLGELLIEAGILNDAALRQGLAEQRKWGGTLGRRLVELKLVREADLLAVLSQQFGVPVIDLDRVAIPQAVLDLVPGDLAQELSVVPFAQPMKFLDVAMADPTNLGVIDELRIRTQLNIRPHLVGPKNLERAIGKYYHRGFGRALTSNPTAQMRVDGADVISDEGIRPFPRKAESRSTEIDALQERMSKLEALVARDEEVLRKLFALLIGKGVATREEILEAIRS